MHDLGHVPLRSEIQGWGTIKVTGGQPGLGLKVSLLSLLGSRYCRPWVLRPHLGSPWLRGLQLRSYPRSPRAVGARRSLGAIPGAGSRGRCRTEHRALSLRGAGSGGLPGCGRPLSVARTVAGVAWALLPDSGRGGALSQICACTPRLITPTPPLDPSSGALQHLPDTLQPQTSPRVPHRGSPARAPPPAPAPSAPGRRGPPSGFISWPGAVGLEPDS